MALKKITPKNFESWFEELFDESMHPSQWVRFPSLRKLKKLEEFSPSVDMYDKKDEVVVKAEIPGISKENISISVNEDVLTIKGELKKEEEIKEEDYYYCERRFGSFSRVLSLPSKIKTDKIKATFENGVLEIHMPKAEGAKQKEVKIALQ